MQQSEPLRRGWRRGAIKDGQVALGLSYHYGEPRRLSMRLLSGDSATTIGVVSRASPLYEKIEKGSGQMAS